MTLLRSVPQQPDPAGPLTPEEHAHVAAFVCDVGARIESERQSQGLTQQELSDRPGVSHSHLMEIEAGGNTSLETVGRLALALGLWPDQMGCPTLMGATARAVAKALKLDLSPPRKPKR